MDYISLLFLIITLTTIFLLKEVQRKLLHIFVFLAFA